MEIGIAIPPLPRDVRGSASGVAAVRKGRMVRTKECERYMPPRFRKAVKRVEEKCGFFGTWGTR